MNNRVVTDHLWFNDTKGFRGLGELIEGDIIQFDARVRPYVKGYVSPRRYIDERELDYRLSHPTKMKKLHSGSPPIVIYHKEVDEQLRAEDSITIQKSLDEVITAIETGDKLLYCINCNYKNEGERVCPKCWCVVFLSKTTYHIQVNGTILSEKECVADHNISIYDIEEFLINRRMQFDNELNIKDYLGEIKVVRLLRQASKEG